MDEKLDEKIEISATEYARLKAIEEETRSSREKPFSLYEKVNIPVRLLNYIIIGGIAFIISFRMI